MSVCISVKKCGTKNKPEALKHLKRKAKYMKQCEDTSNMIDNVEAQVCVCVYVCMCMCVFAGLMTNTHNLSFFSQFFFFFVRISYTHAD
jgi:hypothetical protein